MLSKRGGFALKWIAHENFRCNSSGFQLSGELASIKLGLPELAVDILPSLKGRGFLPNAGGA